MSEVKCYSCTELYMRSSYKKPVVIYTPRQAHFMQKATCMPYIFHARSHLYFMQEASCYLCIKQWTFYAGSQV